MTRTRMTVAIVVTLFVAMVEEATRPGGVARAASFNPSCSVASLKEAINDANAAAGADVIALPQGCVYTLTTVDNTEFGGGNGLPLITDDLTIEGNDGTIERSLAGGTPDFRILRATDASLTVRNITVRNGRLSEEDIVLGAGLRSGEALVIENSAIYDNALIGEGVIADARGAGSFSSGATTILNSTFSGNSVAAISLGQGGGAFSFGAMTITSSTFTLNTVSGAVSLGGGSGTASTAEITNSTYSQNTSTGSNAGSAGGAHSQLGMTVTGSTFSGNSANGNGLGAVGGGLRTDGTLSLGTSSVVDNVAAGKDGAQGGGTFATGASTVERSTVAGNSAIATNGPGEGGGIYALDTLSATNSTISGNSVSGTGATVGGGTFSRLATTLVNATLTNNTAPGGGNGGGAYSNTTMSAANSIIASNTGGDCAAFAAITATATSIDTDGSCGSATTAGSPKLLGLALNAPGTTKTHALEGDSPALGIGASCPATDQRGVPRVVSGCDAGAYELVAGFLAYDVDCDADEDVVDALAVLNVIAGIGTGPQPGGACDADVDNDEDVDMADVLAIRRSVAGL